MLTRLDHTTWLHQTRLPPENVLDEHWIRQESGFTGVDGQIAPFFAVYPIDPRGNTYAERHELRTEFNTLAEAVAFLEEDIEDVLGD